MAAATGVSHEVRNFNLAAPAPQMSLDRALPMSAPGQVGSEPPLHDDQTAGARDRVFSGMSGTDL